jgi:hypothetical protein
MTVAVAFVAALASCGGRGGSGSAGTTDGPLVPADTPRALLGDGLVINLSEPFADGNGQFDDNPDRAHWLAQDPLLLVRCPAGHVGFEAVDGDNLRHGDVSGEATVWQRIISMIGSLNESFPDGFFGPGDGLGDAPDLDFDPPFEVDIDLDLADLDPTGDLAVGALPSPALATSGRYEDPIFQDLIPVIEELRRALRGHHSDWNDEFRPGDDHPGSVQTLELTEAIPPGGEHSVTASIQAPPQRGDGWFTIDAIAMVLGFTEVGEALGARHPIGSDVSVLRPCTRVRPRRNPCRL